MNSVKAVVFDADGTLLDSFELIYSAYKHVAHTHGLRIPKPEEIRSQLGQPLPDIFRHLYPDGDIATLLDTNNKYISENVMKSQAFEGVIELLDSLTAAGLKLAILTSGGSKINAILRRHNWQKYFSSVVHHERLINPKPDAEGFLLAAEECGAMPMESIMVGDTTVDIETGRNAGAHSVIALSHGFGVRDDLVKSNPDYLVDDLFAIMPIISGLMEK
jgi:phosphoglycolate phosphatase